MLFDDEEVTRFSSKGGDIVIARMTCCPGWYRVWTVGFPHENGGSDWVPCPADPSYEEARKTARSEQQYRNDFVVPDGRDAKKKFE